MARRSVPLVLPFVLGVASLDGCSGPLDNEAFTVTVKDGRPVIAVKGGQTLYSHTCQREGPNLEKRVGDRWLPLQDDRPNSEGMPQYLLDGVLENRGGMCCLVVCTQRQSPIQAGVVREYIKTGTQAPPADDSAETTDPIDVIESRPVTGDVRIWLKYATSDDCSEMYEALLPVPNTKA
jgi:hypothetical protein